jgi:hypothetical protein
MHSLSSELKSGSPETRHGRSWVRSKGSVLLSHPEKVLSENATQLWPSGEGSGRSLTCSVRGPIDFGLGRASSLDCLTSNRCKRGIKEVRYVRQIGISRGISK